MSAGLLTIADQVRITGGANASLKPVMVKRYSGAPAGGGDGSERIASGRPCKLEISRDRDGTSGALDGTVGVWGVNLPHPDSSATNVAVFRGDGATVNFEPLLALMPFAAFSNYNWIVIQDGVVIEQGAGGGKFTVTNPSTTQARIVMGTAPANGSRLEVYLVTPLAIRSVAANATELVGVIAKDLMWLSYVVASTNLSRTRAHLTPEA